MIKLLQKQNGAVFYASQCSIEIGILIINVSNSSKMQVSCIEVTKSEVYLNRCCTKITCVYKSKTSHQQRKMAIH